LPAKIFRADGVFRAVQIPRGDHEIVFTYQSRPFRIGVVVSIVSLMIVVGLIIFLPAHEPPDPPATP